jgi:hypothetical protein
VPSWFVSLRTCLVAGSQHFCIVPEDVDGDVVEVCADAVPTSPVSKTATAISPDLPMMVPFEGVSSTKTSSSSNVNEGWFQSF